jgi:hypothetical protein
MKCARAYRISLSRGWPVCTLVSQCSVEVRYLMNNGVHKVSLRTAWSRGGREREGEGEGEREVYTYKVM